MTYMFKFSQGPAIQQPYKKKTCIYAITVM